METVETGVKNRDDFQCRQTRLVMSIRFIFGDDWSDMPSWSHFGFFPVLRARERTTNCTQEGIRVQGLAYELQQKQFLQKIYNDIILSIIDITMGCSLVGLCCIWSLQISGLNSQSSLNFYQVLFQLLRLFRKKKPLNLSLNVISTKGLIGDTIFTSPTRDGNAILCGNPSDGKV